MAKKFETLVMERELVALVRRWGKDGVLDVSELTLSWIIWDDNDTECDDEDGERVYVEELRIEDDVLMVAFSGKWKPTFDSICYGDDRGYNLGGYIHEEVSSQYSTAQIAVMRYDTGSIDIINLPFYMYDAIEDVEDWVLEHFDYKHSDVYVMGVSQKIEIGERDYNECID